MARIRPGFRLKRGANLSDLTDKGSARAALGLGGAAVHGDNRYAHRASNLSDLGHAPTARANLGLGGAAVHGDNRYAHRANNLSDLGNAGTARSNLGLGSAATRNQGEGAGDLLTRNSLDGRYPQRDSISNIGFASNDTNLPYMRRVSDGLIYHLQRALGFTPVQQGGGTYMGSNKVHIGWDGPAGKLRAQIDNLQLGALWTDSIGQERLASFNTGSVGSYAFLVRPTPTDPGVLVAGAELAFTNAGTDLVGDVAGTWRCMGMTRDNGTGSRESTLWLRVS